MSSNQNDVVFFDENGLRTDGRKPDEIRPMKIKIGVLSRANGSCYLEWGANKVLAAVYGPREAHPKRTQRAGQAIIRYRYNMQSFSVEDRARPGPSRRSSEISKVSREAFEPVIISDAYPKAAIDIFVEVLQADAGTRTAAINAASLALVDAGIPIRGLVSACAVGKVGGKIVLDLNKPEDNYGEADLPIAMTEDGKITLVQMDGNLSPSEFEEAMELVQKGCRQVLEIQKAALMEKFAANIDFDETVAEIEEEAEDDFDADELPDGLTDEDIEMFVNNVSERLAKGVSDLIKKYEESLETGDGDLAAGLFENEECLNEFVENIVYDIADGADLDAELDADFDADELDIIEITDDEIDLIEITDDEIDIIEITDDEIDIIEITDDEIDIIEITDDEIEIELVEGDDVLDDDRADDDGKNRKNNDDEEEE
ncbi:exosome complex exonuclease Rrp41 [Methanolapillus ohkumae]|uniref:Exosome complex component Rrp41 n=1 Tax=Methanolapillus ohkumae TaxID=3028298 RepID=A0AA96VEJ8_9EURY|nr:Ribonuclease PH [Methanosarcinaceae archaeon Am2]